MLLEDLRILDLTDHRGELGPWLLGRLGAEVIRVEPPGGSPARHEPPLVPDAPSDLESLQFASYNDNKRSVVLDLAGSAEDRSTFLQLVAGAEIVFDSGPPGAIAAAGISEDDLTGANPELVHVLVTAYGSDGPRANDPASELSIAALGGPMSLQGIRERAPLKVSIPQAWRHTGAEAAAAALIGYRRMQRTGSPQWIDMSAQSAMTWTMLNAMASHEVQGFDIERAGASVALAQEFSLRRATKDGWVICAPIGITTAPMVPLLRREGVVDESWEHEDWATFDHRALSGEETAISYDELLVAIEEFCSRYTRTELMMMGLENNATIAPVNNSADLLEIEHLDSRSFWVDTRLEAADTTIRRPGGPIIVDDNRLDHRTGVPTPDESGDELRAHPARARRSRSIERDQELPLSGIKVADFSWIGVGPITAKALADHGATVVRIEHEGRLDTLRAQSPFADGEFGLNRSNFFNSFNTSKLSAAIDLTTEAGREVAFRMTQWADITIDSFRPGTMDRLGLGHDAIAQGNPTAISVTTSLLGGGGPLSNLAGYGFHASAIAGFTDLVGWPDLGPDGPWMAYTDTIAPRFMTTAILAALDRRDRTGEGCHIEGAQLEIGLQLLAPELSDLQATGRLATRIGNRDHHMAPQGAYPCQGDDEWCTITVDTDDAWQRLRTLIGEPGWARVAALDSVEGRLAHHDEIDTHLSEWTTARPPEEVERLLLAAGISAGKVQRTCDLKDDRQYLHRDFYARLEHSEIGIEPYAGHQYRIRGYDHGPRTAAPCLGEHTYEVLTELVGMTPDEVADAAAAGAIG
ncbi:MAG: CoA transferase [Actinomycetota bacterium]|nr:CoA transferase [Actinomycetota bacterium]